MKKLEQVLSKWLLPIAAKLEQNPQLAAVRRGMMTLVPRTGGDLQGLLFHVLDGTESQPQSPHPLYPRMKEILLSMLIS